MTRTIPEDRAITGVLMAFLDGDPDRATVITSGLDRGGLEYVIHGLATGWCRLVVRNCSEKSVAMLRAGLADQALWQARAVEHGDDDGPWHD